MAKTYKQRTIEALFSVLEDPKATVWHRLDAAHSIMIVLGFEKPTKKNARQAILPSEPGKRKPNTGAPEGRRSKSQPIDASQQLSELMQQVNETKG